MTRSDQHCRRGAIWRKPISPLTQESRGRASVKVKGRGADSVDREILYPTNHGKLGFAPGDRIVLLKNNRYLGVKNGMLGMVTAVEPNAIQVRLDGAGPSRAPSPLDTSQKLPKL